MVQPFCSIIMLFNFKGTYFNYGLNRFDYKKLISTKYEKEMYRVISLTNSFAVLQGRHNNI